MNKMALNFNKFAAEGNSFIAETTKHLGFPEDNERSGRVVVSILHALRNHLTPEESIQLIAQLPMFLKAVYVLNWHLHAKPKKIRHFDDFIDEIRAIHGDIASRDFPTDDDIESAISVVFMGLRKYLSLGELEDIRALLPKEIKSMLNSVLMI